MKKLTRKKWWRSVEGEVKLQEGFAFDDDPDIFYFDVDWQCSAEPRCDKVAK